MRGRRGTMMVSLSAVIVFAGGCSGAGSDESRPGSVPPTTHEPDLGVEADPSILRRTAFGGVTFEFDGRTVVDVTGRRSDAVEPVDARVIFDFEFVRGVTSDAAIESALVVGDPGRGATGGGAPRSSEIAEEEDEIITLDFVNGSGLRSLVRDGDTVAYEFSGVTEQGAIGVDFGPVELVGAVVDETVDRLDRLLVSLFVDQRADTFVTDACEDDAFLVADLTIPDGSVVTAGQEITKTWRLRNDGTCTWGAGYSWTFAGGDPLTLLSVPELDSVGPGDEIDLDVRVRLPERAGVYTAQWHLLGPLGREVIGPTATLVVEVVE